MRCRYHGLLQILGFFTVVAFHSELPRFESGWIAVEVFFAVAGYNMARAYQEDRPFARYVAARYRRLAPPLLLLAPAVLSLIALGSPDARTFALSAPLLSHNLFRFTMSELRPAEMAWIPTWFVAALFQLQALAMLCRRALVTADVRVILLGIVALGLLSRVLTGVVLQAEHGTLTHLAADSLYWSPLTHVEPLVGGLLLGLGRLRLPRGFTLAALGAVAVAVVLEQIEPGRFAFPLGIGGDYQYVWGYIVVAAGAVVLADKTQIIGRMVLLWRLNGRLDSAIQSLSRLTFLGYLLHGCALVVVAKLLQHSPAGATFSRSTLGRAAVTLSVLSASLLLAALIEKLVSRFARVRRWLLPSTRSADP